MSVYVSCEFHGTAAELASHLNHCPYEAVKHYIRRTEERVNELTQMLQQKDQEVSFLQAMLGQLSTKVDTLEKTAEGLYLFNVYSAQRLDLFARCVRLSWLLFGFRTHFKSLHFLLYTEHLTCSLESYYVQYNSHKSYIIRWKQVRGAVWSARWKTGES